MRSRTQVVIVGGGPAGLMLSHLLHIADIDSVVLDNRTVETIEHTHRAGILEHDTVRLLVESGVSDRVLTDGHEHQGISLRFGGESHRIDFQDLAGASCWLYPQTDVFVDLHGARVRDGGDLRYGVAETRVVDPADPLVEYVDAEGGTHEVAADVIVGADGSHSRCREVAAGDPTTQVYARSYPFAWFGVLVQAPPSAPELVYTRSPRGFALLSQRTAEIQRMYFQCDPEEDADQWSDDRIWAELQSRLAGEDGFRLVEGPVVERSVLGFRSFVQAPMRYGRLLLAGDAGHTVPPTGAKGLNLAIADVRVLAEEIELALVGRRMEALDAYSTRALERVWRAQHFSYWMTSMLHQVPGSTDFDERRQVAELTSVVSSTAGSTYLAEGYTGWPRS